MKVNLLRSVFYAACLTGLLAACSDDKYNGPSPDEVNATYTNQLSAGSKANLTLSYNGESLIGKNVYFKMKDAHTGYLSLKQIIPGEIETNIDGIALTADGDSYSFGNTATTTSGVSFRYEGRVEAGRLSLALSGIELPDNLLKGKTLRLVRFGEVEYEYGAKTINRFHSTLMLRMHLKAPLGADQSMLQLFFPIFAQLGTQIGGSALNIVLNKVEFGADGNIRAGYAGWPEGLGVMESAGYPARADEKYTLSPANLATYYFADAETMYVVPHIDQIIAAVQQGMAQQGRSLLDPTMQEFIQKLYAQLSTWARYGVKFKAVRNPYIGEGYAPLYEFDDAGNRVEDPDQVEQYEGDYLLQIDTDQLAIVGVLMEALPYLAPDLCDTPLSDIEALADYAGIIQMMFPEADTVGSLLTALHTFGNNLDFEIGLLFNQSAN